MAAAVSVGRFEFLEILVRAAFGRYITGGLLADSSDSVARLLEECLEAYLPPEAKVRHTSWPVPVAGRVLPESLRPCPGGGDLVGVHARSSRYCGSALLFCTAVWSAVL